MIRILKCSVNQHGNLHLPGQRQHKPPHAIGLPIELTGSTSTCGQKQTKRQTAFDEVSKCHALGIDRTQPDDLVFGAGDLAQACLQRCPPDLPEAMVILPGFVFSP